MPTSIMRSKNIGSRYDSTQEKKDSIQGLKQSWIGSSTQHPRPETARGRLSREKKRDDKSSDSREQALHDSSSCPGRESPVSLNCQLQEGDRNCREKEETRSLSDHKTLIPPSTCSD